jgi:hypothetical protein
MADLRVRFVFSNGTGGDASHRVYPLFRRVSKEEDMTWAEFSAGMEAIQVQGVDEWCRICKDQSSICGGVPPNGDSQDGRKARRGLSPPLIGAVVVIAVLVLAVVLFWGYRRRVASGIRRSPKHSAVWLRGGGGRGGLMGGETTAGGALPTLSASVRRTSGGNELRGGEMTTSDAGSTLCGSADAPASFRAAGMAEVERRHSNEVLLMGHERTLSWTLEDHQGSWAVSPTMDDERTLSGVTVGGSVSGDETTPVGHQSES